MSASPQLSPAMGNSQNRLGRSDTPQAQPLSKREKRRTQLLSRLDELTSSFSSNRDTHYRRQLQAIQLDTGLILHALPYVDDPIVDLDDNIEALVKRLTGNDTNFMNALNEKNIGSVTGKLYAAFANEVRDAMEERDASIALHNGDFNKKVAEANRNNTFVTKLANEEHRALANSLRDRLMNNLSGRRIRLNKEKESENITDSNALLMHPNQFSITNPSSPGGVLGKRTTRHRRDIDDLPGMVDTHKRKRRAIEDSGSPGPGLRLTKLGFSSAMWTPEAIAKAANSGADNQIYSIDKLFTEKELTLHYNSAATAAHRYIVTHTASGSSDESSPSSDAEDDAEGDDDRGDSPPLMQRQASHATRSTRGVGAATNAPSHFVTATGIEAFTNIDEPRTFARLSAQMPKMPPPLAHIIQKGYNKETANVPASLSTYEAEQDHDRINALRAGNGRIFGTKTLDLDPNERGLLLAATLPAGSVQAWLAAKPKKSKAPPVVVNGQAEDTPQGGVPMSLQSSQRDSETPGIPMSRENSTRRKR